MMGSRDRELAILQSRLFLELRRTHCRVIDLKWMNEDARYARHVLDLAGACDEEDIRELGRKIAQHMRMPPSQEVALRTPAVSPRRAADVGSGHQGQGGWWRALQLQRG